MFLLTVLKQVLMSRQVISGILCKNADDVAKANFYNDELQRIIDENENDALAEYYDVREGISDYECASCAACA